MLAVRALVLVGALSYALAAPRRVCRLDDIVAALRPGSSELRSYVDHVYGPADSEADARTRDVDFHQRLLSRVNIVYLGLLPSALRNSCIWPREPTDYGSIYELQNRNLQPGGSIWVYRYNETGCPYMRLNRGRVIAPPPDTITLRDGRAGWIEVTHSFTYHYAEQRGLFWMYRAVGSGMWYRAQDGIFEARSHEALHALAATSGQPNTWASVRDWALARAYRTLFVTHRCETWSNSWYDEIVGVLPRTPAEGNHTQVERWGAQPRSGKDANKLADRFLRGTCRPHFARGYWPSRLRQCECCAWNEREPTWCAFGNAFSVQYGLGEPMANASSVNTPGVLPYIIAFPTVKARAGSWPSNRSLSGAASEGSSAGSAPLSNAGRKLSGRAAAVRMGRDGAAAAGAHAGKTQGKADSRTRRSLGVKHEKVNRRKLQNEITDIVRRPELFESVNNSRPRRVEADDTLRFWHMTCAQQTGGR
jgi:hypothetical protein